MTDRTGSGDGAPPDGSHPHVLVADVQAPVLDEERFHHLSRVRRLRPGDRCTVTDGAGAWRWCVFRGNEQLEADGDLHRVERAAPELTVAFALTKGDKPEWTVQKLTELGIDRIVPFRAERSVVRWDDAKAARQVARLRTVAEAAVEQSRRCWLAEVADIADIDHLAAIGAVRADRGGDPPGPSHRVVAVGPEGGWTDQERARLPRAMALGDHVLRAETAALTAGALLGAIRSEIVVSIGKTTYAPRNRRS